MAKSIFTNRVTQTLEIPGTADPVQTVTIRKLAPRHLEAAETESQRRSMENVQAIGGPALLKEFMALGKKPEPATAEGGNQPVEPVLDPLVSYDRQTLVAKAVLSWTCEEPFSPAAVDDLDEDTLDWLSRAALRLARPKLFLTADEREAARGNDSGL